MLTLMEFTHKTQGRYLQYTKFSFGILYLFYVKSLYSFLNISTFWIIRAIIELFSYILPALSSL